MAASITNSNETLDSITTGLLIHEVGFFMPPPLRGLCFHKPSFLTLLDSWYISYPHTFTPPFSLSYLRQKNIVSFGSAPSPNHATLHNSAVYTVQVISGKAGIMEKQLWHFESLLPVNGLNWQKEQDIQQHLALKTYFPYTFIWRHLACLKG